ncbi:uncharacterized protein LOC124168877 [Ischnura elegans]|uniref:uncharacterized protein LOC124168877 n=1 Tax=Ischnura elegans TaxID=197161 RepID=UPI001ED89AB7|nr:uncharacterized protein LOC124168877 [Ischnura elegans]XP_046403200.1 uncharacterized protein LOC124168877 [Ischnura elegans]XP_046403201.1 uncharacterized protein LOC124168877 [Ischnura elegans]XP_046403202.1 uncharacterized protein LOC124168877 [Ischnura elegans]
MLGYSSKILGILSACVIGHQALAICQATIGNDTRMRMIFDFTTDAVTKDWVEQSDTVRTVGKSKACFSIQKTQQFRRAVFFSLLNPQDNGAGFAGSRILTNLDLSCGQNILIKCRGQGNINYKIILRHKGENDEPYPTWEKFFESPTDFSVVSLSLNEFKPYYRGQLVNTTEKLDTSQITSFGIQIPGGVYSTFKQRGPSSLEIDWIALE